MPVYASNTPDEQVYDVLYCTKSFNSGTPVWHTQVEGNSREDAITKAKAKVDGKYYYIVSVTLHESDLD